MSTQPPSEGAEEPVATDPAPGVAHGAPMFQVTDLKVHFPIRGTKNVVKALDGVDLEWRRGEVLGIVGESGCGKSTLGRALMGLQPPTSGEIKFEGEPLRKSGLRKLRRRVQMIFQDPYQSLNPRMSVATLVQEGLQIHKVGKRGNERVARAVEALEGAGPSAGGAVLGQVPARALGRPAPARGDRRRARARARGPRLRRAGLGA